MAAALKVERGSLLFLPVIMNHKTRHTLLQKALYLSDEEAWSKLIVIYKPLIIHVLQQYNLKHHDIQDLSQRIFIKLTQKLQTYDREKGQFRYWLGRVIKNEAVGLLRSQASKKGEINTPGHDDSQVLELITTPADQDQLFDQEWERFIYARAWENVKGNFSVNAQRVFELSVQGKSAPEITEELQVEYNTVRNFKSRVKRAMRHEVERLEQELDEGGSVPPLESS